jgi:hypothetical protein
MTFNKDVVNSYYAGVDLNPHPSFNLSVYYSLAAARGLMQTDGVNCQIGNGPNAACRTNFPNWRLDSAASPAVTFNFPDTASRLHEVVAVARFKLTTNVIPKVEYRYQRFDYRDFQTSVMNPNAFVGPLVDPAGSTGLQRMLFLGADNPGYKVHVLSGTVEYRF